MRIWDTENIKQKTVLKPTLRRVRHSHCNNTRKGPALPSPAALPGGTGSHAIFEMLRCTSHWPEGTRGFAISISNDLLPALSIMLDPSS